MTVQQKQRCCLVWQSERMSQRTESWYVHSCRHHIDWHGPAQMTQSLEWLYK